MPDKNLPSRSFVYGGAPFAAAALPKGPENC
jgi:hypothetical protein